LSLVCPKYIKDAVKRYDDNLDVVFDNKCLWWNIVYGGIGGKPRNVCICVHDDGSIVRGSDLSLDEILRNIRQMDKANVDVLKQFDENEKNRHYGFENEKKQLEVDNIYHAEDIKKFCSAGLSPFVCFK
jgi:hypothetical protein